VNARDKATGKDQKITITSSSGLSKEEVDRMAKEAEAHAGEDKERREAIEARNQLDSTVYNIEKMLKEHGDKISGHEKSAVESALTDAKKALEGDDAAIIKSAQERLIAASHKLAEQMYKTAQPGGDGGAGAAGAGPQTGEPAGEQKKDEGVIDAEYVDVDEKKN
jgi:molecular chaperone DnaK